MLEKSASKSASSSYLRYKTNNKNQNEKSNFYGQGNNKGSQDSIPGFNGAACGVRQVLQKNVAWFQVSVNDSFLRLAKKLV